MRREHASNEERLDPQWVSLILEARSMGMSIEDIRKALADLQEAEKIVWKTATESVV